MVFDEREGVDWRCFLEGRGLFTNLGVPSALAKQFGEEPTVCRTISAWLMCCSALGFYSTPRFHGHVVKSL